jgi:molybdopterin-guanine dinucleotide biosynthesis protein A
MIFDAVILAGGRAARLGGTPKPGIVVAGATLLDHALAATRDAACTVVVGPPDALPDATAARLAERDARRIVRTREDPPFGGPVAGIDAGLRALAARREDPSPMRTAPVDTDARGQALARAAPWVVVLAVDVPRAALAVPHVVDALAHLEAPSDGAFLVRDGHPQWLVGGYRRDALLAALDGVRDGGSVHGVPVKRLVAGLACVEVPDAGGWSDDVDTWDDVRAMTSAAGPGTVQTGVGEGTA